MRRGTKHSAVVSSVPDAVRGVVEHLPNHLTADPGIGTPLYLNERRDRVLRVSAGLAERMIVETARQTDAKLVVLAARTGMAVMPGTVSQYVPLKSYCPVTIVPHDGKDEETDNNHP
jgi:hypothetical protein